MSILRFSGESFFSTGNALSLNIFDPLLPSTFTALSTVLLLLLENVLLLLLPLSLFSFYLPRYSDQTSDLWFVFDLDDQFTGAGSKLGL